ncbi:MAG: molybdopterin-dependent oxidoreductase, partial [Acidobacteriota bacterium]
EPLPGATSVRIVGFDDHSVGSTTSHLGCSWIFTLGQLRSAGAFLATHMNGERLTPDHGAPIRLMVPGWYGCSCVKWVERIELVGGDEPATSQMKEFALRTHQTGVLERAAEYRPATIVRSALPVRVEQWRVGGKMRYRVVGIEWGGDRSRGSLQIRFRPSDPFALVDHQPTATPGQSWSLWSHAFTPTVPGPYLIQLGIDDPSVAAPRLDAGHYIRGIKVTEI